MSDFPKRVKELRRKLTLSQHGLAGELGVTLQTVSRWERGLNAPQAEQLFRLRKLGLRT